MPFASLALKRSNRIGARLAGYVLVFALIMAASLSGVQYWQSHQAEGRRVSELLDQMVVSNETQMADIVWEEDGLRARQVAERIVATTDISHVVVRSTHVVLAQLGQASPQLRTRTVSLRTRNGQNTPQPFGEFTLGVDMASIDDRLASSLKDILLRTTVLISMIVGMILLLFRYMVTRHLAHIGHFFSSMTTENLEQPLELRRAPSAPESADEFDKLVAGVARMQATLADDIRRRRQAEDEVRQLNEVLEKRVEERTAALKKTLDDLMTAQAQLIQSEKMATLGQLVASVAHEINTPIGAVKSSGGIIAAELEQALNQLPSVILALETTDRLLLMDMIRDAKVSRVLLSSREERTLTKQVAEILSANGIDDARHKATILIQLRAHEHVETYLPLLKHPDSERVLQTVQSIAAVISSSNNINAAVERVAKILFALKSFSRVGSKSEFVESSLREGLDTVLTIYASQLRHDVELICRFDDIAPIPCLPDELNQVWTNLIHNALQAMNHKGTLTISLHREGNDAVVSVGDSGCGIPEEIRESIFKPFFTTKPVGEGSGLGLEIVRKIVERHHGRISYTTEIGAGTVFHVRLPYDAPSQAREA